MTEHNPTQYEDSDEYEYHAADDSTVKTIIRERRNGGLVSVYHYDPEGVKQSYHRFRINSIDNRRLIYEDDAEKNPVVGVVFAALHAGGWTVQNQSGRVMTLQADAEPLVCTLLDLRDQMYSIADGAPITRQGELYRVMGNYAEEMVAYEITAYLIQSQGKNPQEEFEKDEMNKLADIMLDKEDNEHLTGALFNIIDPSTKSSDAWHTANISTAVLARDIYRESDKGWFDALDEATEINSALGQYPD